MAHILLDMDDALQTTQTNATTGRREAEDVPQVRGEGWSASSFSKEGAASAGAMSMADDGELVRIDRVEALRAAIANGTYRVSASELADKILHSMQR